MKAIRDYIGTLIDIEPSQLHSASTRPRLPCLTTHMSGMGEIAKKTPCCKQPISFSIARADPPPFYKFKLDNVAGDRLFRAEPHYRYNGGVVLRSLNENMLTFNEVAMYIDEKGYPQLEVFASWKQVYFQLPANAEDECTDFMHLVVLRVKDGHLEFAWFNPRISISRADIAGSAILPL